MKYENRYLAPKSNHGLRLKISQISFNSIFYAYML